jgi:hypothetical protein
MPKYVLSGLVDAQQWQPGSGIWGVSEFSAQRAGLDPPGLPDIRPGDWIVTIAGQRIVLSEKEFSGWTHPSFRPDEPKKVSRGKRR